MQNSRWAMGAAILALGLAIPAAAGPGAAKTAAPSARREIQAIYRKIDAAIDQKDADTAFDYDADDCQYYDKKGHLLAEGSGRQEAVDVLDTVNTAKETTVITSFTGSDTDATATTKGHVVLSISNNINGRAAKISFDDISRDYWVKTDDGWKRKRSRELKGSFAIHKNF
jgi:hypothetical protein